MRRCMTGSFKERAAKPACPRWVKVLRGRAVKPKSVSEWADEILALDQLLNEGFLVKPLQRLADEASRPIDGQWRSLRLLQDYLEAQGKSTEEARAVMAPLVRLHALRNPLKGHGSTNERKAAQKQARSDHGTLRAHFTALVTECDRTLATLLEVFGVALDGRC